MVSSRVGTATMTRPAKRIVSVVRSTALTTRASWLLLLKGPETGVTPGCDEPCQRGFSLGKMAKDCFFRSHLSQTLAGWGNLDFVGLL